MSSDAGVSIVFVTHRREPRFDWFADSLAAQLREHDDVEVIFVDGLHSQGRTTALEQVVQRRFAFRHVPPKPTPYNGPFRLTSRDYFAPSSARNTGIVYSRKSYVVFVDDVSVLMPGWLEEVREAARRGYVVGGAYWKQWDMVVEDGRLVASRAELGGRDSRWSLGRDRKLVKLGGGQLFGCSCGFPRELLVAVNGYDELCDSFGGEDWELGLRLERVGAPIYYSRRMLTVESEELHRQNGAPVRLNKFLDELPYMQRLFGFGVPRRATDGRDFDVGHMLIDISVGTRAVRSIGNYYDLSVLNETDLLDLVERFPRWHWFDRQPLSEL
jgi:glycosyltransferase involved in cell wall biosynthesis